MKTELQKQFESETPSVKEVGTTEYLQTFITWLHLQVEKPHPQIYIDEMWENLGDFCKVVNDQLHPLHRFVPKRNKEDKTESQRLRSALYIWWDKDHQEFSKFEDFYSFYMEKYINHVLSKIDPFIV